MTQHKRHPGELCSAWFDLPVSGICTDTGERLNFTWKNIDWGSEVIVEGALLVSVFEEGTRQEPPRRKEYCVNEKSLTLVFPDAAEQRTALQNVALDALKHANWRTTDG